MAATVEDSVGNFFRWLASWVSDEGQTAAGGVKSTVAVKATDFKETVSRTARDSLRELDWWKMGSASTFIRLAGVSGFSAIFMGAYGAHSLRSQEVPRERVLAFEAGNRYHLVHSVALLASPLSRYPITTGMMFTMGMVLFSGTCYIYAMTGRDEPRRVTPIGGFILMLGWLSLVL